MSLTLHSLSAASFILLCLLTLTACNNTESKWTDGQLKIIESISIAGVHNPPNDPSNQYSHSTGASAFGQQIFFDKRFSSNGKLSCASCHQPQKAFTDGLSLSKGINETGRNTQSLIGSAYQRWFYWDGRKDSLWSQALVPFESANEMASSRVHVLRVIGKDSELRNQYETLFGDFPISVLDESIAENAGPWGDTETRDNWYRIPVDMQRKINRAYTNVGKAIAAYETTIPVPKTKFDEYVQVLLEQGEQKASKLFTDEEKAGLNLFIDQEKSHCLRCHNGPLLSNSEFHNIGTGTFTGANLDFGRFLGIQAVVQDEFNCMGEYSDADAKDCHALRFLPRQIHNDMQGAYKTPSLRYLNKTGPYFHDGRFTSLEQVMEHYLKPPTPDSETPELVFTETEKRQLIAFLETLGYINSL